MRNYPAISTLALIFCVSSFVTAAARATLFDLETRLTASDAVSFDEFGVSVAISGNTALVGATSNDARGFSAGSAYLFVNENAIPEPSSGLLLLMGLVVGHKSRRNRGA